MASAWGNSWALAWGSSWGTIDIGGGGSSSKRKRRKTKHQGWRDLEAQIASFNSLKQLKTVVLPVKEPKKAPLTPVYTIEEFQGLDALEQELKSLRENLEQKETELYASKLAEAEIKAHLQDEEEAITVLLMLLEYERNLLGIPMGLKSSSSI